MILFTHQKRCTIHARNRNLITLKTTATFVVYNSHLNLDDVVNDVTTSGVTQNEYLLLHYIFVLVIF